jgi:hypothetical protein
MEICEVSREALKSFIDEKKGKTMLEIGPFYNPFIRAEDGHTVFYADILSKDEIFQRYHLDDPEEAKRHNPGTPQELYEALCSIDFVIKKTYEKAIGDKKFYLIFSSHVLEHVNDVISHLLELSNILEDSGYVVMAIPDKRFTFDYYRSVTPFRDMIDAYIKGGMVDCIARLIFDQHFNDTCVNVPCGQDYRENAKPEKILKIDWRFSWALGAYKRADSGNVIYALNTHNWVFTYSSFLEFLRDGLRAALLPYTLYYCHPPVYGSQEFTIILKKDASILDDVDRRTAEIMRIHDLSENEANNETNKFREEIGMLKEEIKSIQNSRSWRITKPLRAIMNLVRAINKGGN